MATQTEAFRRWFGQSVVRNADGTPMVVYHGSPDGAGIYAEGFRKSFTRGETFFATDNHAMAASYADAHRAWDYQNAEPGVLPLYLSIQNPLIIEWEGREWRGTEKWIEKARKDGHDGFIARDVLDYYNDNRGRGRTRTGTLFVWFRPSQAKSAATGSVMQSGIGAERGRAIKGSGPNRGTFDPGDANILHGFRRR